MYYNARFYDPKIGRFIQADSIVPNAGNPQDLNRYSYVDNNPIRFTDPSGHKKKHKSWLKWAGIIAGAVLANPFTAGLASVMVPAMQGILGATMGSVAGSAIAGAGGAMFGAGITNAFQGQNPFNGAGKAAIAGAATGAFFNASVFQPVRDGISSVTNPIYRSAEATIRYAARIVNIATFGYPGQAFNAFQGAWNYYPNNDFSKNYLGRFSSKGSEFGVNKFSNFDSLSPFTEGTNVVAGKFPALPQYSESMIWSHEMSHAFQNQILGPIREVMSYAFNIVAAVPVALNPQYNGALTIGSSFNTSALKHWAHAIDPTEHGLQSYHGSDLGN